MSMLIQYLVNFPTKEGIGCQVHYSSSFHKSTCPFPRDKVRCSTCMFTSIQEDKHKAIDILGKLGE